jgi:hypothetical protein
LVRLVLESHTGRALVPIPKRSAAPRATSTLSWWIVSQKVLDLKRPIREEKRGPASDINAVVVDSQSEGA